MNDFHRVSYNGLIADIKKEHLDEQIEYLKHCNRPERKAILKSVEKCLATALKKGARMSPQELQDICNDIGVWFANEVFEGRAERYKVAVQ